MAVLTAVRGLAAVALKPGDFEGDDDHDISELLVDGLLDIESAARVRRIRLQVVDQMVYEPRPLEGGQVEGISESSMREALASVEPIVRRGEKGQVVALIGRWSRVPAPSTSSCSRPGAGRRDCRPCTTR